MCELLGMSANTPTDICFSFSGLMKRGGVTGPHSDGWGIVFYEGKGYRCFRDYLPGCDSVIAHLVSKYPIKSKQVIAHIRQANSGRVCLENTHPFTRELWGRQWSFAHNGQLHTIKKKSLTDFIPVGTTDSEHAFCWIMDEIKRHYTKPPRAKTLMRFIHQLATEISSHGVFNFLIGDGVHLFCYCTTKLCWITRQAPFSHATLKDDTLTIDFHRVTTEHDVVSVVATEPLTLDEPWLTVEPGQMLLFRDGGILDEIQPRRG